MRTIMIQCLFCGALAFGLSMALFFVYFHYHQMSKQWKIIQEPTRVLSFEKNAHQQMHASVKIPKQCTRERRTCDTSNADRPENPKLSPNIDDIIKNEDPQFYSDLFKYGFNAMLSRKLGHEREVPDSRNKICRQKHYSAHLPTASVIICFHNEEFNALLRTVSSVVYLSPQHSLEEVILVDDKSEFDDLKEKLDYNLEIFRGKVKVIRNTKREGLIRSKMIGATRASGDILVFLDSHSEVNKMWLEPLLYVIAKDPKIVVCPVIDVIDAMTLEYEAAPVVRGAFDWNLKFKWDGVFSYEMDGPEGPSTPIRSPAMAGEIFAIHRHYFNELGQYDKGMELYGGENIELSLRIWMCGGQLFIIPCSRVGHISRTFAIEDFKIKAAIARNNLRVVNVWLDEYKGTPDSKRIASSRQRRPFSRMMPQHQTNREEQKALCCMHCQRISISFLVRVPGAQQPINSSSRRLDTLFLASMGT